MIQRIKCFFGFHADEYTYSSSEPGWQPTYKFCPHCKRTRQLKGD